MEERDFQLLAKAKKQVSREASLKSFLVFGVCFTAFIRMLGVELPMLYLTLFVLLLMLLIFSSDLLAMFGRVSKNDLIGIIERQINNDPETLTRYIDTRSKI